MFPTLTTQQDDQLCNVTPRIMGLLKGRLEQLIVKISRVSPSDAIIKKLTHMVHMVTQISEAVRPNGGRDNLY
jgi:hypothetical protein